MAHDSMYTGIDLSVLSTKFQIDIFIFFKSQSKGSRHEILAGYVMPQGLGLSVSSQSDLMVWCVLKLNECLIFIDLKWQSDCLCDLLSINVIVPGKNPTDEYLEAMMMEAPGPINFTMFLTMFGERLNGTDPEDVIRNAFACFDEEGSGK